MYVHCKKFKCVLLYSRICTGRESDSGSEYHAVIITAVCLLNLEIVVVPFRPGSSSLVRRRTGFLSPEWALSRGSTFMMLVYTEKKPARVSEEVRDFSTYVPYLWYHSSSYIPTPPSLVVHMICAY